MTAVVRPLRSVPRRPDWSLLPERVHALAARAVAGCAPVVETYAPATGAQREWAARPIAERAAVFARFHALVLREQAEILDILQTETGKARSHAFEEVADV